MPGRALTYSRVIAWLKILLPLVALALLSTLFLFARSVTPTSSIPFAKIELEERAREQRITAPFFSGQTQGGDLVAVTAESARPDPTDNRLTHADQLHAEIDFADGSNILFDSANAEVNSLTFDAHLSGDVRIVSSNGYSVATEALSINMKDGTAFSDQRIEGRGPAGTFSAESMELTRQNDSGSAHLLFKNGVKLVYTPKNETR